ncbi:zinc-dependent alcohol dehydrogenase family protein [Thermoleptolyngbya sichuanensis XZ-Cy5]|uniref:zinc-dependent alcohol dehydrogenase family protein n=1 Tax=Thermoleptolyngbya sichuanensis TaxID=2885951 RepID=UPI00240DF05B|nr:zinc-dependent alcohol dehydrogenase family protein [Thermoleptolyngbya sichuanensis]MDG2615716.1 zinc-dependent alcohol dehydrogenase family protein [Thermoleptolyngbya sichuanensis XZ-Cy5]
MKAVLMTAPGVPEVLQLRDVPEPRLTSDTALLVRLKAAGVNPIDTKLRKRGTFYPDQMPAILGCDGAGVVEAVGAQVKQFHIGEAVYFCQGGLGGAPGTYAEFAVVEERCVAPKPPTLSFAEAAAAPLVLITAWEALCDRARLQSGQTVMVQAGAGGVGHVAIQLARLMGAQVYTTVSTEEKSALARDLGAAATIDYRTTDPVAEVMALTQGAGVDVSFDTVGGGVLSQCFAMTRVYGDVVSLLAPDPQTDWKTARDRNLRVSFELMLTPMLQGLDSAQAHQSEILHRCAQWIDQGKLRIILSHTVPLAEAAAAHRLLEEGSCLGKIALAIAD